MVLCLKALYISKEVLWPFVSSRQGTEDIGAIFVNTALKVLNPQRVTF